MKKIIILSVLAFTVFASCSKEQLVDRTQKTNGVQFELFASTIETKTTNSGMVTSWKADDAINLFHAETSTTSYSENDQFTITSENLSAKKFTGTLTSALDPAKSYDWYALYPYHVSFTTPANTTAYVNIGSSSRNQTNYDNADHLGGLPLVGKATNVAAADKPAITMNHMAAVVKIIVTNSTTEDLTITNVSLTTPKKITGQFIVNFSDPSSPVYSDGTYNYNYCNLKVNGGTALGNGESATFYIPIKPIALDMGEEISIKVNTYTKAKNMPSAFTFTPGKMTTINFDYDKTFTSKNFYLASSIAAGDKVMLVSGTSGAVKVMAHYGGANNYPATDGTITSGRLPSTSAMGIFTVAGNSSDGYTLYDPETEMFITATNTTDKNYLKGVSATDDYCKWGVAFAGAATFTCKGKASRNVIKYNSASSLFSAYNSEYITNVGPVYLFKQDDRTPISLTFANETIEKTTTNYGEFTGQTATATPSVSPITYSMTGDAIGTITAATGAVSLNGTAGTATVTATFAGNATYAPATTSYTITVLGKSITLTASSANVPSSYGTANTYTEYTLEGYKFKIQQIMKTSGYLQLRASDNANGCGTIYNTQKYPGNIKAIVITYNSGDSNKNCTVKIGSTENPTEGTAITPSVSGNVYTFDCSSYSFDYFVLANGLYAGKIDSIKIEWK